MRLIKVSDVLFLLGAVLIGAGVSLWLSVWNPDALLREPLPLYRQVDVATTTVPRPEGPRTVRTVRLANPDGGEVRFVVSLPPNLPEAPLPALVVVPGPGDPRRVLAQIPAPGANAVIVYDYPYDAATWRAASLPARLWTARDIAFRMPDEVTAIIAWARRQEWIDPSRVSLVGISLGAVALPVIRHRAAAAAQKVGPSVLAYGGVDLHALARANLEVSPGWLRDAAAWLVWLALRPLEPATHLPEISGPFLLINGSDDPRIPRESIEGLRALTPSPRKFVTLDGGHINNDRPAIIAETIRVAREWLREQGALDP